MQRSARHPAASQTAPRLGESRSPRVALIADSLGLPRETTSPRDRSTVGFTQTYAFQLKRLLDSAEHLRGTELLVNARRNRLMRDVAVEVREAILNGADAIIVHVGICDCAPRVLSRTMHSVLDRVRPGILQQWILARISKNRRLLIETGRPRVYTSERRFATEVREICKIMKAAGITMGAFVAVAPPDDEMEARSPGYEKNTRRYNAILADEARAAGFVLLDIAGRVGGPSRMRELSVEGQHFNAEGNALVAVMIHEELVRAFPARVLS